MKKAERHQMKRDELVTMLERASIYLADRQKHVIIAAIALVLLLVGGLGLRSWLQGRELEASLLVGRMIRAYDAPIVQSLEDLPQAPSVTPIFTSGEERDLGVLHMADEILSRYGSARIASRALYYKGLALSNLGRHDEALAALGQVVGDFPKSFLAPMARYRMARLRESQGEPGEALIHYQSLAEDAQGVLPREEGLLGMARCQEALGNADEALEIYRRILTESPESDYTRLVRSKVADLS